MIKSTSDIRVDTKMTRYENKNKKASLLQLALVHTQLVMD